MYYPYCPTKVGVRFQYAEYGSQNKRVHIVTADIIAHQVLLNRVPEQATEDSVRYQIYY